MRAPQHRGTARYKTLIWTSSIIRKRQGTFFRALTSIVATSYDVKQTSHDLLPEKCSCTSAVRSSFDEACSFNTLRDGSHRANSFCHPDNVVFGTNTKWGPFTDEYSSRYPNILIDWRVLPRPISSAKMPFKPLWRNRIIQFRPAS